MTRCSERHGWPPARLPATAPADATAGRAALAIQAVTVACCPQLLESLAGPVASVRELVVSLPAPGRDHRPDEDAALVDDALVGPRIVQAHVVDSQSAPLSAWEEAVGDVE